MSMPNEGSSRQSTPEPAPVGALGYTEAATELDRIIAELDRGVVDVDVLEDRLCRAVEIVEELDRRIQGARERVDAILPRLERVSRGADAGSVSDE
jgi:exonuclease VII small subunit